MQQLDFFGKHRKLRTKNPDYQLNIFGDWTAVFRKIPNKKKQIENNITDLFSGRYLSGTDQQISI